MVNNEKESPLPLSYDKITKEQGSSNGPSVNYKSQKIMNFVVYTSGIFETMVSIKSEDGMEYISNIKAKSAKFKNKSGNVVLNLKECNFHYMRTLWEIVDVSEKP